MHPQRTTLHFGALQYARYAVKPFLCRPRALLGVAKRQYHHSHLNVDFHQSQRYGTKAGYLGRQYRQANSTVCNKHQCAPAEIDTLIELYTKNQQGPSLQPQVEQPLQQTQIQQLPASQLQQNPYQLLFYS